MDNQIREFSKRNNKKRILKRVVSLLCVVVLLFTMNTLKRSANTLERIPMCGMIEHIHGSDCYNGAGELACGMAEHVHTDACYQQSPTGGGTMDNLDINIDGYDSRADQSDVDGAQSLDLSLDLSQGDLLDSVQNPKNNQAPRNNQAPANNDLQVGDLGLIEDPAPVVANNAASNGQEVVVEFEDDTQPNAQQNANNTEKEQEQPADIENIKEETENTAETEKMQAKPAETEEAAVKPAETEEVQEQPVETETETEEAQEQVDEVEEEAVKPFETEAEEAQEQPTETETETEEAQEQADATEEAVKPSETEAEEAQEQPAETEAEVHATTEEAQEQVDEVEEEAVKPFETEAEEAQEQPTETETETEEAQEQADATEEAVKPSETEAEEAQEQPSETEAEVHATTEEAQEQADATEEAVKPSETEAEEAQEQPAETEAEIEQVMPVETEEDETEAPAETVAEIEQVKPVETEEDETEAPAETVAEIEQVKPVETEEGETEAPAVTEEEQEQADETEEEAVKPAETETETEEGQEQPAETEDEGEQSAETEEGETEVPAVTEEEQEQADETEEEAEKPAETETETETETEEAQDQPAETATEDEQEQSTDDEDEGEQSAETEEGETEETVAEEEQEQADVETQATERRYTATVDFAEVESYPISLRGVIDNATPAEDYEDAPEAAEEKPVDEWSIEIDPGLFEVETTEDDVLLTPVADFESTEIIISNGSRYELTLMNCTLEQPEEAPQTEPEAQVARPAQHFEKGTTYMNVVVDAPEGAFPEGTVMVVKDVEDEGTLRNIEQSVAGDFVEVTSVHAVDISFWYNDAEIEPLLPIAVVMSAVEADEKSEAPVVVHVTDDGETSVVNSESIGATEAALEMPATENPEAQAFEADSFSVYAIVGTQTLVKNYIDDSGKTWSIKVGYTEEAGLPEGARLEVAEIEDSESYLAEAEAALDEGKRITKARFFDIRIVDADGNAVQPKEAVQVTATMLGDEGTLEAGEGQTDVGSPEVLAMHFVERNDEIVKVVSKSADESGDSVTFTAEGFSPWGVVYTVDFAYVDEEGVEHFWSFPGTGSYSVSEVLKQLGIRVKAIESAELELVEAVGETSAKALYLSQDEQTSEWLLNSEEPFNDTYTLTVSADGKRFEITVTDFEEKNVAKLVAKTYNGENTAFNWDMVTYRLYWYAEYTHDGQKYFACKSVYDNPELKLSYLTKNGNEGDQYNGNAIQCPNPSDDSLRVYMIAAKGQDTPVDNGSLRSTVEQLTGSNNSFGGYSFTDGTLNGSVLEVTATRNKPYTVEIKFQDSSYNEVAPSDIGSGYKVYATLSKGGHTYFALTDEISLTAATTDVPLSRFRYNKQDHEPEQYYSGAEDISVQITQNGDVDNNGALNSGTAFTKGDTIGQYELTSINKDTASGKTTIIFRQVQPYTYSFKALDVDGATGANVDLADSVLSDENWYLVTKLVKAGNGANYYKVVPLGNLNGKGATAVTGRFSYFYQYGVESSQNKSVYVSADTAETRLVHMTSRVDQSQYSNVVNVFNDMQNNAAKDDKTQSKYFTGGDGLYKYTVRTVDSSGQGAVTLTKAADPKVTVNAYNTDGTTPAENLLAESGADNYYLYARLTGNPEFGYLKKLDTAATTKDYTISAFEKLGQDGKTLTQKYLTGTSAYDAWIIKRDDNNDIDLSTAYNAFMYGNNGVRIYQNGGTVGCAVLDRSRAWGDAAERNTVINLTMVSALTLNSKVFDSKAATNPAPDPALTNYYILLTMQEDGKQVYHLQKLDVNTLGSQDYTIDHFTEANGAGKYYYIPGKTMTMQLLTSASALTLNDVVYSGQGTHFNSGSVTGELYQVELALDGYAITSQLRKLDDTAGTAHTVNTYFYGVDKATTQTIAPALGTTQDADKDHKYYYVATLKAKGSDTVAAYQIVELDMEDTDGAITAALNGKYNIIDANGNNVGKQVGYDPAVFDVKVRLFHKAGSVPTNYNDATVTNSPSDVVPGYDFMSNEKLADSEVTEIKLHKAYEKDYKVRVEFDPSSPEITSADGLYLLVTLEHQTTGTEYGFVALGDVAKGVLSKDYSNLAWYKKNNSGIFESVDAVITGNEKATVRLLRATGSGFDATKAINNQDCLVFGEGDIAKACTVSYAKAQSRKDENNATTHITDYVQLTAIPVNSDYSFTDILGQGVYYGINANVFNQQNHIQSNFAVNDYYGNGQPIEADLASEAGAFIATDVHDSMFIGSSHSGDVLLYVNPEDAYVGVAPRDARDFVYTVQTPAAELKAQVDAILNHGQNMSNLLATHQPTFTPKDSSTNYIEIDTYDFPENATIYLDGDALRDYIKTTSGIKLTKRPGQMIVFNFEDGTPLTLGKFEYRYGRGDGFMVSDSPVGHGDTQNDNIDLIAKHVVWNVQKAKDVDINICTGMYLIPNEAAKVTVAGTSSGWIITGGKVTNTGGEWHSVYGELPSVSKTNLNVGKTIDGKTPNGSQVFNFTVDHLNNGVWEPITFTVDDKTTDTIQNTNGTLKAENITVLNEGWNIYRIKESAIIPDTTSETGEYTIDGRAIYAVVQYVQKVAAGGSTAWIATTPTYYMEDENGTAATFSPAAWTPGAADIEAAFGSASGAGAVKLTKETRPAFLNTTKKDRLSISKVVTGTADNTKQFSFTLQVLVPDPNNGAYTTWLGADADVQDGEPFTIQITGMDEPVAIALPGSPEYSSATYKLTDDGEVTFTLTAGQTAGFNGLPVKHKYVVTENNLNVDGTSKDYPGYALLEGTEQVREGVVNAQNETSQEPFTNVYTAEGKVDLSATKTLFGGEPEEGNPAQTFTFQLKKGEEVLQTVKNNGGTITFDTINFTQDDMVGATKNAETGLYEKTLTYTIVEVLPVEPDPTISYDTEPKTVTVKLVDDGAGHITANKTEPVEDIVFNNNKKTSVTVSKQWKNADGTTTWPSGATVTVGLFIKTGATETQENIRDARGNALDATALEKTLTASEPSATWEDLAVLEPGSKYIVKETAVSGVAVADGIVTVGGHRYSSVTDGETITNTELTEIDVQKIWAGDDVPEDAKVVVQLYSSTTAPGEGHHTAAQSEPEPEPAQEEPEEQTVTTRNVPVSINWTGTPASGSTVAVTATPADGGDTVTTTLSGDGWSDTLNGMVVGKTYNVTFVSTDTNATVNAVNGFTVDGSNSIGTNGRVATQSGTIKLKISAGEWKLNGSENVLPTNGSITFKIMYGGSPTEKEITISAPKWSAEIELERKDGYYLDIWNGNTIIEGVNVELYNIKLVQDQYSGNGDWIVSCNAASYTNTVNSSVNSPFQLANLFGTVAYAEGNSNMPEMAGEDAPNLTGMTAVAGTEVVLDGTVDENGESAAWYTQWTDLPTYDGNGNRIYYYVVETEVRGISASDVTATYSHTTEDGDGYKHITHVYIENEITESETTEATVKKVWNDANNQDGKRPESLTVILSNGTEVTLNEANSWEATVSNLPKTDESGNEIEYTWTEGNMPAGYALTDTSKNGKVTTLTNTHSPEETEATVRKVWDDNNDQDGIRPESLTVTLSNGTTVTLNEANGWTAKVENLPKYANGVEIEYTWTEGTLPAGYTLSSSTKEGTITTLTNTHTPVEVTINLLKVVKGTRTPLQGAEFTLTKLVNDVYQNIQRENSNDWVETSGSDGKLAFANLPVGSYRLEETHIPNGYGRTSKGKYIYFDVTCVEGNAAVTWVGGKTDAIPNDGNDAVEYQSTEKTFIVENTPGARLPATGGVGTGVVYGAGAALILLAVLGLVLMNRKRSRGTGI